MKGFTSRLVHGDRLSGVVHGSLREPTHGAVTFGYEDARELAAVFQGKQAGFTYGRQGNPTVEALQNKITALEGGVASLCFGTGMAAIGTLLFALLRRGDHFVSSAFLFGNTNSLFRSFAQQGLDVTFVDATSAAAVADAITPATRLVFVETIANPRTQVTALPEIGALCRERKLVYVVDNTMTSPWLFQAAQADASLVTHSLTKYISGHGETLGGAITEMGRFDWRTFANINPLYQVADTRLWGLTQIKKKGLRDFGASLAPETAHRISVGAETLALRLERQCANAQAMAEFLDARPEVRRVYYPGLPDHPQHDRARTLFRRPGALLSFELDDSLDIWAFMNALSLIVKSTHLGDNRTLAIPVAHTIYHETGAEQRAGMGIRDGLVRISLGIEEIEDLLDDLATALAQAS